MKKITIGLFLFMLIVLTGCSGKSNTVQLVRDFPKTEVSTALELDKTLNGKSLNTEIDRNAAYSDVKLAEDANASLFYNSINISEYTNQNLHSFKINVLFFTNSLQTSIAQGFINEMNNETYGVSSKVTKNFKSSSYSDNLLKKLNLSTSITLPSNLEVKENDDLHLVVIYLPTYCIHFDGTQEDTKVYLMVPVYYAFTYKSEVQDYVEGIRYYSVSLENGLLPNDEVKK